MNAFPLWIYDHTINALTLTNPAECTKGLWNAAVMFQQHLNTCKKFYTTVPFFSLSNFGFKK